MFLIKRSHVCCFLFGLAYLCMIMSEKLQVKKFQTHSLCAKEAIYGTVLDVYELFGVFSCVSLCISTTRCKSCTFDDTKGICQLNSEVKSDLSSCDQNVKYVQVMEHTCLTINEYRICGLGLFDVDGEVKGYIEVNINGVWGTVCDDNWEDYDNGPENAQVLCRSIGYCNGTPVYPLSESPSFNTGPILMDDFKCDGTEMNLMECEYSASDHYCKHDEDIQVRCFN